MTIKEVNEIKKLIKQSSDSTIRLFGCYVSGDEKEKLTYINTYLSELPEADQHKFVEIIRKTLSGSIGRNLLNLSFTEEGESEKGQRASLMALLDNEFASEEMLDTFYDHVIESFEIAGNYLILIAYDTYDVPVKAKDQVKLDDSREVYKFMITSICPVNLSKPALSYHADKNSIENRERDWVVDMPCSGFLFPSFNDRSTDIYSLLYYIKSPKEMYNYFIENGLGCREEITSDKQKAIFNALIEEIVIDNPDYEIVDVVRDINESITELIEEKNDEEPILLGKEDIKGIFRDNGIKEEDIERIDKTFTENFEDNLTFDAESIQEKRKFEVKTNDVTINVKPENAHTIEVKIVDGVKCIVIPMDMDVEINGIMSAIKEKIEEES